MNERFARLLVPLLLVSALTLGCETAPQPVVEPYWQKGARSATSAEPAPEVQTAQKASVRAEGVVANAMKSVVDSQNSSGGGPNDKNAPVIAVANLEPSATLHKTPGPEANAAEVARWIATALAQGNSGKWIQRQLDRKKPEKLGETRILWKPGDFNGDDRRDLAVAFFADCERPECTQSGRWTVGVVWGGGGWSRLATSERFPAEFIGPADLTGDERPELIFTVETCGAHTCYQNLQVLSAHGTKQFRRLLYLGDDIEGYGGGGLPQKVELVRRVGDQLPVLKISGGMVGSAGAGTFQRVSQTLWGWNRKSGKLETIETTWEPSKLRLHRFHDAIVELERGNDEKARQYLGEVVESGELVELPSEAKADPKLEKAMREQLQQTAKFMLARLALQQGKKARFSEIRQELHASGPKRPPSRAAEVLASKYAATGSMSRACQAAAEVFPEKADDDWVLDSLELGYNAPVKFDSDFDRGLCAGLDAI